MELDVELSILDEILNFNIIEIPSDTRFWMIRTKKGYFYNEFIAKKFVALAWNSITSATNFSEQNQEYLRDNIVLEYPEIKRPQTVINKCNSFINEVKENDILVIPSEKSKFITFALLGEYYEDESKSVELERIVIERIEKNDVAINDVSCPYRKRRKIIPLRTVRSEEINYSLYRAISNYHGISSFDNYARHILGMIYDVYSFKDGVNIIFNVRKEGQISPRYLSGILYGVTNFLCNIGIQEDKISTHVNINSPGPIDFNIVEIFEWLKNNYLPILGMMIVLGGGSFLTFKLPGIPQIIKDIFSIRTTMRIDKAEADLKELEVQQKKLEILEKIKSSGINPEDLEKDIITIYNNAAALDVQPIANIDATGEAVVSSTTSEEEDNPE